MEKIEKTISRDLALADIYAWHRGYTLGMKKAIGWSYSDSIFFVHDGVTDIMRPPREHLTIFRNWILKKIDSRSDWLDEEYKKFFILHDKYIRFCALSQKKLSQNIKPENILVIYLEYITYIEEMIGPFITFFWLPIWLENDDIRQKKYHKQMSLSIRARQESDKVFPLGAKLVSKILKCTNIYLKLDQEFLSFLSAPELIDFLGKGKSINQKKLIKRSKGFVYSRFGITSPVNSKNIKKVIKKLGYDYQDIATPGKNAISIIKGQIAARGFAKGRVRIIISKSKIKDFKNGEILVSSMTTPEYVPAMKKAKAIITDEGGITCHAAIVSREMKKPCIIGTKIATRVLKDGDFVEVDADKGVVEIIKK